MATLDLDAVGLVRKIRDEQYEQTQAMSPDELLEFLHREAAAANAEAHRLIESRATTRDHA